MVRAFKTLIVTLVVSVLDDRLPSHDRCDHGTEHR